MCLNLTEIADINHERHREFEFLHCSNACDLENSGKEGIEGQKGGHEVGILTTFKSWIEP